MKRPPYCNCRCISQALNCLGCDEEIALPESWVMDFPAEMGYGSARTGSVTIAEYDATGYPQAATGGTIQKKRYFTADWDWPDLTTFGISTSLVIDDAPLSDPYYGSHITCIWANETFSQYRVLRGRYDYSTFYPGSGGPYWHDSMCSVSADFSNSSPWYYYSEVGSGYIPPGLSPGRTRNSIDPEDALCGTFTYPGDNHKLTYECAVRTYGCFAVLTVVKTGTVYDLVVTIYWWPRIAWNSYEKFYFLSSGGVETWNQTSANQGNCDTTYEADTAIYTLDGNDTGATVYPSNTNGISQGAILIYKKTFACDTEFDGSPVTLPLFSEVTSGGASQTIVDAIGITNVPPSITITPVI